MEDWSETSNQAENGEKTQAVNEENIAKAAASALAAAAVKAKVAQADCKMGSGTTDWEGFFIGSESDASSANQSVNEVVQN